MRTAAVGGRLLLLALWLISAVQAGKRFQDVMEFGRSSRVGHHSQIQGWSPDSNSWDEKLYPAWKSGDPRWENCWKGGKVVAVLTSDSPALIGSNITFAVNLQFPRCQKENEDGDIVYRRGCGNATSSGYQDQYVYNWTKWEDFCNEGNCSFFNRFPDGKPFPHHHDWRRHNFIYIFQTLGQYYQKIGKSSAILSINTTNITAGAQAIEVSVFRRSYRRHYPVAKASSLYLITDEIPFYVNISQKNDKNSSDSIFIKDSPIQFDVKIHDPSHYLKNAILSFNWNYGDNGSFVSNNPLSTHTYTMLGNFSLNLTIKAAIPGPCKRVTTTSVPTHAATTELPTTMSSTTTSKSTEPPFETESLPVTTEEQNVTTIKTTVPTTHTTPKTTVPTTHTTPKTTVPTTHTTAEVTTPTPGCFIYRYGYYNTKIQVVDGIVSVNIIEMSNVQVSSQAANSIVDFMVSCEGSLPTDACTTVSDASCMIPQNMVCDEIPASDQCLFTLRRAFVEPGSYCVNITLSDGASLALASTLVSVGGPGPSKTISATVTILALVALAAAVIGVLLYKKYKEYKPIKNAADEGGSRLSVYFSQVKEVFSRGNDEHDPLLKNKAGII